MIDFTECEQLLKKEYNIDENVSLVMLKMEKITNKTSEKNIQYQMYEPFNMTLLNMSICENTVVKVYIPHKLSGETLALYEELKKSGYNLFDKNDKFYNDICTPFTSPNGTDISLSARQKYIYSQFANLCQENCELENYSYETELVSCNCKVNTEPIEPKKEDKFNPKIIYESFFDILKYSNYKVLKCYDLVLKYKTLFSNKGSIIVLVYFMIYLCSLIAFAIKGISYLKTIVSKFKGNITRKSNEIKPIEKNKINEKNNHMKLNNNKINKHNNKINKNKINHNKNKTLEIKKNNKRRKNKRNNNPPTKKIAKVKVNKNSKIENKNNNNINKNLHDESGDNNKTKNEQSTINISKNMNKNFVRNKRNQLPLNNTLKSNNNIQFQSTYRNILDLNKNHNKNISIYNFNFNDKNAQNISKDNQEELSNYELNNLEYEESIKTDKREFAQIYWSILKREHLILFTFFSCDDYNLASIKFARFIFLVCTDMALNVFFFSDDSMNAIFLNYGKYDFIQKIPQMVYSVIVSQLIEVLLCFLSLTDKYVYQIKRLKLRTITNMNKIYRIIQLKLCFFFIITFLLFIFYWYIISAFCAVYMNTQIIFIKDSAFSFILGFVYPFILYLFPSCLRIICLKNKNINLKCLYKLSDIIPIF